MSGRIDVFGCPVDAIDMAEALDRIDAAIRGRARLCVSLVNTAKLVGMRRDPDLFRDVLAGDLILPDGAGILLAAKSQGTRLPARVAGIDLMLRTVAMAAKKGYRPYFLGARPKMLERAVANLVAWHPGLDLAGWHDGYFQPEDEARIVEAINVSNADCLFVALPTPMKEQFLFRNRTRLETPLIMGVGGSLDVVAGAVARAPVWAQRAGLEWLFRMMQEPMRMGRRYLGTNSVFAAWLLCALVARAAGQRFAPLARA